MNIWLPQHGGNAGFLRNCDGRAQTRAGVRPGMRKSFRRRPARRGMRAPFGDAFSRNASLPCGRLPVVVRLMVRAQGSTPVRPPAGATAGCIRCEQPTSNGCRKWPRERERLGRAQRAESDTAVERGRRSLDNRRTDRDENTAWNIWGWRWRLLKICTLRDLPDYPPDRNTATGWCCQVIFISVQSSGYQDTMYSPVATLSDYRVFLRGTGVHKITSLSNGSDLRSRPAMDHMSSHRLPRTDGSSNSESHSLIREASRLKAFPHSIDHCH